MEKLEKLETDKIRPIVDLYSNAKQYASCEFVANNLLACGIFLAFFSGLASGLLHQIHHLDSGVLLFLAAFGWPFVVSLLPYIIYRLVFNKRTRLWRTKKEKAILANEHFQFIVQVYKSVKQANKAIAFWNRLLEGMETKMVAQRDEYELIQTNAAELRQRAEFALRQAQWLLEESDDEDGALDIIAESDQLEAASRELEADMATRETAFRDMTSDYETAPIPERVVAAIQASHEIKRFAAQRVAS